MTKEADVVFTRSDFKILRICILVASVRHPTLGKKRKQNLETRVLNGFTSYLAVFNSTNPVDESHRALPQQFKILLRCI